MFSDDDPSIPLELVDWKAARETSAYQRIQAIKNWSTSLGDIDPLTSVVPLAKLQWSSEEWSTIGNIARNSKLHEDNLSIVTNPNEHFFTYIPPHSDLFQLFSSTKNKPPCDRCCVDGPQIHASAQELNPLVFATFTSVSPPTRSSTYMDIFRSSTFSARRNPLHACPFSMAPWSNAFFLCFPNNEDVKGTFERFALDNSSGIIIVKDNPHIKSMSTFQFTLETGCGKIFTAFYFGTPKAAPLYFKSSWPLSSTEGVVSVPEDRQKLLPWLAIAPYINEGLRREFHSVIAGFSIGRSLRAVRRAPLASKVISDYPADEEETQLIADGDKVSVDKGLVLPVGSQLPFVNTLSAPRFIRRKRSNGKPRVIVDHTSTGANDTMLGGTQKNTSLDKLCAAISQSGHGSLVIVVDVVQAYKNVKLAPFDWPLAVEHSPSLAEFLVELRHQWGSRAAGFAWEPSARLLRLFFVIILCILAAHYIDDYTLIIPPNSITGTFDYQQARITVALISWTANMLGLKLAKWQVGARANVLGANLNLWTGAVSVPEETWLRAQKDIETLLSLSSCSVKLLASLAGSLVHFSRVHSGLKAFLPTFFGAIASRVASGGWNAITRISKQLKNFLRNTLKVKVIPFGSEQRDPRIRLLFQQQPQSYEEIYTDASMQALGFVFPETLEIITLPLAPWILEKYWVNTRLSIPGLEALSVVTALLFRCMSFQRKSDHFVVHTDSLVFCLAAKKGYSTAPLINEMLVALEQLKIQFGVGVELRHIPTGLNFADMPTKIYPPIETPILINSNIFYIQGQRRNGGALNFWVARTQAYPDWANIWLSLACGNISRQG
jgi:hypothetical protein